MNPRRERIVAAFESLKRLLCDLGYFVEGDSTKGVWVRYWGNQRLRELKTFLNGLPHGFAVVAHGPANPHHFRHYKNGELFGEATSNLNTGRRFEHLLLDGEHKIPYSAESAKRFHGYLTTDPERSLFQKYHRHPSREAFLLNS